jgi:hypothetical protein
MITPFQQQYIQSIKERPDVRQFVDCQMTAEEAQLAAAYTGPRAVMFYTQDNVLHVHRVGQRRLLQAVHC